MPESDFVVVLTVFAGIVVIVTFLLGCRLSPKLNWPARIMEERHRLFGLGVGLTILLALMTQ